LVVIGFMLAGYDSVLANPKSVIMSLIIMASGGVLLAWEPGTLQDFVELFRLDTSEVQTHPEVLEEPRRSGITIRIAGGPNAPKSPAPRINSYHL
jgi:hypothetical protein